METFLQPPDGPGVQYEFFHPFAHIPGKVEACRIRSPSHGLFDCIILLGASTAQPAHVYVNSDTGARFMAERYPECATWRVAPSALGVEETHGGSVVEARLQAAAGPVRGLAVSFRSSPAALPRQVPYGGTGEPVWGSRWTCWGVDLVVDGQAEGSVIWADGRKEALHAPAVVTRGSFGRLAPR